MAKEVENLIFILKVKANEGLSPKMANELADVLQKAQLDAYLEFTSPSGQAQGFDAELVTVNVELKGGARGR